VCGRYTLAVPDPAQVRERFPIGEAIEVRRRFNVAPGDEVLAVTTDREGRARGELLRWGLIPSWSDVPKGRMKMINARAETVSQRPAFRVPFERFRCLIVADGFYEWQGDAPGAKQAFHITRADGGLFAFAGLWSVWRSQSAVVRSCAILTTAANAAVAPLHDRMPVILEGDAEEEWLDRHTPRGRLTELLAPLAANATALMPVGPAVNDARFDGPECLEPAPEPPPRQASAAAVQATLF
jgi:putative SOS response-associated peptidase YedK